MRPSSTTLRTAMTLVLTLLLVGAGCMASEGKRPSRRR